MKYHLEEEYEYDFDLYGISSHEKDYRICWAINNSLGLSLERTGDVYFTEELKALARLFLPHFLFWMFSFRQVL